MDVSRKYSRISSTGDDLCAIDEAGSLRCAGWDRSGEILRTTSTFHLDMAEVDSGTLYLRVSNNGELTTDNSAMSCGISATALGDSSGALRCWGTGYLGNGTNLNSRAPPVVIQAGTSFIDVATGASSGGMTRACAITSSGQLKCWGYTGNPAATPTQVTGGLGALDAGGNPIYNSTSPVDVDPSTQYISVSLSGAAQQFCGITSGHKLKCWGRNSNGDLGVGPDPAPVNTPQVVDATENYSMVSVGSPSYSYGHGAGKCGLTMDGRLKCWSGYIMPSGEMEPTEVMPSLRFRKVQVGATHACAETTSGTLLCWGSNDYGQLGDGGLAFGDQPVEVVFPPPGQGSSTSHSSN